MVNTNEMIFGVRAVLEALEAGKEIDKILVKRDIQSELSRELFAALKGRTIPVVRVPVEKLNRITRKNHQGVIAYISAVEYAHVDSLVPTLYEEGKVPFLVLLDGITDVRNFGSIARTCDCAGVDAIVVPAHGSAAINDDAIKSSSGALLRIPVCREDNLKTVINYAKQSGMQVCAATEKSSTPYTQVDFTLPTLLIMGAEGSGVSNEYLKMCNAKAKLPMLGEVESLNVSVAAGVFMYEVLRQRGIL